MIVNNSDILLNINDLSVEYRTEVGVVQAANRISFDVKKGETLGLVGETGAGKTTIALSILRLIANPPGIIVGGKINFRNQNLLDLNEIQMRKIRGRQISMIFQDPMTSLNPVYTIGEQIRETIEMHGNVSRQEATEKAIKTLEVVGITKERYYDYPHQFSGGMKQRVIIAIALSCNPELLIADEPTTALDVTIQAQILEMMNSLKRDLQTSMIMITHDLGIVAEMCDRVAVIYAGEIVEIGTVRHIFEETKHPYTVGLFNSLPSTDDIDDIDIDSRRLKPISGLMPDPTNLPMGCKFGPRCPFKTDICDKLVELISVGDGHQVRCIHHKKIRRRYN